MYDMKWMNLEVKMLERIDSETCRVLICEAPNGTIVEDGLYAVVARYEDLTDVSTEVMLAV